MTKQSSAAVADLFGESGPNAPGRGAQRTDGRDVAFSLLKKITGKSQSIRAIQFLGLLHVPEGKKAGKPLKLADFQRKFVKGALAKKIMVGVLSIGRGNAKTALSAGLALGELVGALEENPQPKREIIFAARNRDQAKTAFQFLVGYRGTPVPLMALEQRNTVAAGTPDPIQTRPIIDRLFPSSVAAKMGAQMIQIGSGAVEWPVTTSAVTAGWADGETANVPGPTAYVTTDKALKPEHNLGIHMRISRKAMLQSGEALEAAIRRDMNGTMAAELDKAIFRGTGANGQPLGVVTGAATYGITSTAIDAAGSWGAICRSPGWKCATSRR